jgi:hypothetical protein
MYNIVYFIIILVIIFASNYAVLKLGSKFYKDKESVELFDSLHYILPDLHTYDSIVDFIGLGAIISLFFVSNGTLITEFLAKFTIIMFIRAFTTIATILPKHKVCDEKIGIRSLFLGGCYDKIFSGHTSFILLMSLLYYREHIITLPLLIGINATNILAILATRSHYTVDVLLAIFVSTTIYSIKI